MEDNNQYDYSNALPLNSLVAFQSPKWEYLFYEYATLFDKTPQETIDLFGAYGDDGWELVQEHLLERARWETRYRAIFKRIKQTEDTE